MAGRREVLETALTLRDDASDGLNEFADKLEKLDGDEAEVALKAEARNLKREISAAQKQIIALDDEEATVEVRADKEAAQRDLARIEAAMEDLSSRRAEVEVEVDPKGVEDLIEFSQKLEKIDGDAAEVFLKAEASKAQQDIARLNAQLAEVDGDEARVEVKADKSQAERDLAQIEAELKELDGRRVTPEVDVKGVDELAEKLAGLDGPIGDIGSKLGSIGGPSGAVVAIAGGLLAAGEYAADAAIEVQTLATLLGDSTEYLSALRGVVGSAGVEFNDLSDIILNMNEQLTDSPELAAQLGINLNDGKAGGERFVEVVDKLRENIEDTGERSRISMQLFGEEGVRQVAGIQAIFGDLTDDVENFDGKLFTQDDVRKAAEYKKQIADIKTEFSAIASFIGTGILPAVSFTAGTFGFLEKSATGAGQVLQSVFNPGAKKAREESDRLAASWLAAETRAEMFKDEILALAEGGGTSAEIADQLGISMQAVNIAISEASIAARENGEAVKKLREPYVQVKDSIDDVRAANHEATESFKEQREAAADTREELRRFADDTYAFEDAQDDLEEAIEAATEKMEDEESTARDVDRSLRDVARSADEFATKQVDLAGETTATESGQRLWNESMTASAQFMSGPMRTELLNHIARVNGIPESRITEVEAMLNAGNIEGAIEWITRNRMTTVTATVDAAKAESDLAWLTRRRDMRVDVKTGGIPRYADGTRNHPGGLAIVGENGPELAELPKGTAVNTAGRTRQMLSGGGRSMPSGARSAGNVTIIQNFPAGATPRNVAQASRRYNRIQGPL